MKKIVKKGRGTFRRLVISMMSFSSRHILFPVIFILAIFIGSAGPVAAYSVGRNGPESTAITAVIWKWYPYHYQDMVRNFLERLKAALAVARRQRFDAAALRRQVETRMHQVEAQMRITRQRQESLTQNHQNHLRSLRQRTEWLMRQHQLRTQQMKRH